MKVIITRALQGGPARDTILDVEDAIARAMFDSGQAKPAPEQGESFLADEPSTEPKEQPEQAS